MATIRVPLSPVPTCLSFPAALRFFACTGLLVQGFPFLVILGTELVTAAAGAAGATVARTSHSRSAAGFAVTFVIVALARIVIAAVLVFFAVRKASAGMGKRCLGANMRLRRPP